MGFLDKLFGSKKDKAKDPPAPRRRYPSRSIINDPRSLKITRKGSKTPFLNWLMFKMYAPETINTTPVPLHTFGISPTMKKARIITKSGVRLWNGTVSPIPDTWMALTYKSPPVPLMNVAASRISQNRPSAMLNPLNQSSGA